MAKVDLKKKRLERIQARAERLGKKVGEAEKKLEKRTGDAGLRLLRKRMKRAQRRLAELSPKKPPAPEAAG